MTDSAHAVFLSYASEDEASATRIAAALRAAGVLVWFDRHELRGGDAWDQRIREQIRECRLFVPIVSASTEARSEGYFRREWKLAADRTHDMSDRIAFLLPVVIDETSESRADVPDAFRNVHWTRLRDSQSTEALVENIRRLLDEEKRFRPDLPATAPTPKAGNTPAARRRRNAKWSAAALILLAGMLTAGYFLLSSPPKTRAARTSAAPIPEAAAAVPDKSVAVLPFVDASENHDQEYFSEGMAEELIDLLVKIPGLHVPARSSSFYFKGRPTRIQELANQLRVANVLEGTVRKHGDHLRVSARLVQARTGYSLWSETYDRELRDVFQTQDEIAASVVKALKVSLLEQPAGTAGRTSNDEAYELYLQARSEANTVTTQNMSKAYASLKKAVDLDPNFALAWAGIAQSLSQDNWDVSRVYVSAGVPLKLVWPNVWETARAEAREAANRALQLAPDSAEAHFAKAIVLRHIEWDWPAAADEFKRALALAPDDSRIMLAAAELDVIRGRIHEGIELAKHAETLDPLGKARRVIAIGSAALGDFDTAETSARRIVELYPTEEDAEFNLGCILLLRRRLPEALEAFRRSPQTTPYYFVGPPLALDALGRHAEAERQMAAIVAQFGVDMAYQIAYFYARRGDSAIAVDWLERARVQHDGGLSRLNIDPMLSALRGTPAFSKLLRELHFETP